MVEEEIPIPFPGQSADPLPGGGWRLKPGYTSIGWDDGPDNNSDGCAVVESVSFLRCTRDRGHVSQWHVAEIDKGQAVAVWHQ